MTTPDPREMDAIARRYLARVALRYVPAVSFLVAILLVVTLVPSRSPNQTTANIGGTGFGSVAAPGESENVGGQTTSTNAAPAGTGEAVGLSSAIRSESALPKGLARTGVRCAPGVRQMSWSSYAPHCVPVFRGSNGGATSPGVTKDTITVSYRISESGQSAAVSAQANGASVGKAQDIFLQDLTSYVDLFNKSFELYGRKVVIKTFQGQGDWVAEYQGQNQAGAQADAVTAKGLNAFADVSMALVGSSPLYYKEVARQKIISIGGAPASRAAENQYAPYIYSVIPPTEDLGSFWAGLICQRMAGLNAKFAGDPATQNKKRVFGLMAGDLPEVKVAADRLQEHMTSCGARVGRRIDYSIDIPTMATQSTNAIAQMKAAGVTTVLCLCDTITPTFMTDAADAQGYNPEWGSLYNQGDTFGQQRSQNQWEHSLSPGPPQTIDYHTLEGYKVIKMAKNGGEPADTTGVTPVFAYMVAMELFGAIQAAGPNLTPAAFARGHFSLPPSLPAAEQTGYPWKFGPNIYSPVSALHLTYWDPDAMSRSTGKAGTLRLCRRTDGALKPIQEFSPSAYGAKGRQLDGCFGS